MLRVLKLIGNNILCTLSGNKTENSVLYREPILSISNHIKIFKFFQIFPNLSKSFQIFPNLSKYFQIIPNLLIQRPLVIQTKFSRCNKKFHLKNTICAKYFFLTEKEKYNTRKINLLLQKAKNTMCAASTYFYRKQKINRVFLSIA